MTYTKLKIQVAQGTIGINTKKSTPWHVFKLLKFKYKEQIVKEVRLGEHLTTEEQGQELHHNYL